MGARAVADLAGDVDGRQEVHFGLQHAVALTGFAAAALHIEAEAAGLVSAGLAFGQAGEPVAAIGDGAGISGGVGAGRAADGGRVKTGKAAWRERVGSGVSSSVG